MSYQKNYAQRITQVHVYIHCINHNETLFLPLSQSFQQEFHLLWKLECQNPQNQLSAVNNTHIGLYWNKNQISVQGKSKKSITATFHPSFTHLILAISCEVQQCQGADIVTSYLGTRPNHTAYWWQKGPLVLVIIQFLAILLLGVKIHMDYIIKYLFGVWSPTQEFFIRMESSPLLVKGSKFWPTLGSHGYWAVRDL